jgi:1-acyl-sn-glycerol-3-phosphate acyltransferase
MTDSQAADQTAALTQINLDDLVRSFGWEERPVLAGVLRLACRRPAKKFARLMVDFDRQVGEIGLGLAARGLLRRFCRQVVVIGRENLPTGPMLALSNHPGMVDTLALFAALQRPNLRIIAAERPFLAALYRTVSALEFIPEEGGNSVGLVRRVSKHLQTGGAVLTFPSGEIDPDPEVYPGAVEALANWSDSAGMFVRLAPETAVVPVLVRGVIWRRTAQHALIRLIRQEREARERLAAAIQLLAHIVLNAHPLEVTVQIGLPLAVGTGELQAELLAAMRRMIENGPRGDVERII